MYAAFNNGMSVRSVAPDYQAQTGEVLFPAYPTTQELGVAFTGYVSAYSQQALKSQIEVLEKSQTPRRIREAILGLDNSWLASSNTQIAALRAQLV